MNYYLKETDYFSGHPDLAPMKMTASVKPRADIEEICSRELDGYLACSFPADVHGVFRRLRCYSENRKEWKKATAPLQRGDTLLIQFPPRGTNIFQNGIFKGLRKKGVRLIFFVHDLDWLRAEKAGVKERLRLGLVKKGLRYAEAVVVHNEKMKAAIPEVKARKISLGIFDYLSDGSSGQRGLALPVVIAGNLKRDKAGYAYQLPRGIEWNLYGPYYTAQAENIHYKGAFPPEQLLSVLDGSFGLVWDGDNIGGSSEGDAYRSYLRYNNPHKTSLYLAGGLPVIMWREAALADFILSNDCGFVVDSLLEIPEKIGAMSSERYEEMRKNAASVGERLREGFYTKQALKEAIYGKK